MSDAAGASRRRRAVVSPVTLGAAVLVVLLALGAMLWPRSGGRSHGPTLLVYDSSGSEERVTGVFGQLRDFLASGGEPGIELVVVGTVGEYRRRLAERPEFVWGPDGLAVQFSTTEYVSLVVGRRPAPRNLRPRGVLVSRRAVGQASRPWLSRPGRTVFGDSVSLVATGVLRQAGMRRPVPGCASGPDPYDHSPVLHALRLGAFDHAVVRQWDAERFFAAGLLSPADYVVEDLVEPVPDMVLMVSRQVPSHVRLKIGDELAAVGRHPDDGSLHDHDLGRGLAQLHLVGFNLLLEPDLELVRKNFARDWLPGAD